MVTPAILDTSKVIFGASGSGKTVTAKAEVQQLLDEHRQVVVIKANFSPAGAEEADLQFAEPINESDRAPETPDPRRRTIGRGAATSPPDTSPVHSASGAVVRGRRALQVLAAAGMSAAGGTFGTYLGRLRAKGLIEEKDKRVRLTPALMEWV